MEQFADLVMGDEFASMRANRDFNGIAAALNVADQPAGWIPARHVLAILIATREIGPLEWIRRFGSLPSGEYPRCPIAIYSLTTAILTSVESVGYGFKIDKHLLVSGAATMLSEGLVSQATVDAILAGEARISRAEQSLGRRCNGSDCLDVVGGD